MPRVVGDELFIILAAVFGALSSALLAESLSWMQKATVLLTGAGFAVFVGPATCEYFGVTSPYAIGACLYFGGVVGNIALLKLLAWFKRAAWSDIVRTVLDAYRGGKPS